MRILFVGNSYTFFNDLPNMFKELLKENGIDADVESVSRGGRKLIENFTKDDETSAALREKMDSDEYDVMFLQEQSILPIIDYDKFLDGVTKTKNAIKAKRVILYCTWGRKRGHAVLAEHNWTTEGMAKDLKDAYSKAALAVGAEVSYVGDAFLEASKKCKGAELYNSDLTHPSRLGTALAALVHYKTMFSKVPDAYQSLSLGEYAESFIDLADK